MVDSIINSGKQFYCGWLSGEMECKFHGLIGSFKDLFISGDLEEFTVSNQDGFPIFTDGGPVFEVSALSRADTDRLLWKVNQLLASGYLERCNSEWSSPVRPTTINGELDICVDYKGLNSITEDYRNGLPTMQDVLYSIGQSDVFSKIVLKDAYHQLALGQNSRRKTAFWIDGVGQFQFRTFHHGLKNAEYALQWTMDELLEDLDPDQVKVYRGQILVHTNGYYDHLEMLRDLFRALRDLNLKVDVDESEFFQTELLFLGKIISKFGIGIHPDQLDKILWFNTPEDISDVRSFLGTIGQYKSYVSNNDFDYWTRPLRDLISSNRFYWGYDENKAFINLKNLIASAGPIPLQQPNMYY